jgi:hypothetical protein
MHYAIISIRKSVTQEHVAECRLVELHPSTCGVFGFDAHLMCHHDVAQMIKDGHSVEIAYENASGTYVRGDPVRIVVDSDDRLETFSRRGGGRTDALLTLPTF